MAYSLYLDEVLFPVTPSAIRMKVKNRNHTLELIGGDEINILKEPGLAEMQFDLLLPNSRYPFAVYPDGFKDASHYISMLEALKIKKKSFRYLLSRVTQDGRLLFDTSMQVSLEEYQIRDDAGDGLDITVSVELKQYKQYGTKLVSEDEMTPPRSDENAPNESTYTVVRGDSLWNIAKKTLGNGARYMEIYNLNKDKIVNPNRIYPGQVLMLP